MVAALYIASQFHRLTKGLAMVLRLVKHGNSHCRVEILLTYNPSLADKQ
jgi:hypothetical protein